MLNLVAGTTFRTSFLQIITNYNFNYFLINKYFSLFLIQLNNILHQFGYAECDLNEIDSIVIYD